MRVATRRARAVIRAARPVLGDRLEPLSDELKWLGGALGEVRDLDVLIDGLRRDVAELDNDARAGERLLDVLDGEREAARRRLLDALEEPRYLLVLARFDGELATLAGTPGEGGVKQLAADAYTRLHKKAGKLGDDPSDEKLHRLRIKAKRARYAAELAEPDGGKRLRRYIDALKELQDAIGAHQDAVVAEERVRAIVTPPTAVAAGRLVERQRAKRAAARRDYPLVLERALAAGAKAF
jgi:CHAD domain-containing protein